jgi:hypothetical protein
LKRRFSKVKEDYEKIRDEYLTLEKIDFKNEI